MEMRCLKENVLMDWRVGSGQSQAVVEGEITLPGGLREEARVLYAGGMAVLSGAEALQDRILMTGRVVFHTLYTQGDPDRVQSIEATADFTHTMDLPGVQQRMLCQTDCLVEHVEASTSGGRLMLRAVVQCYARVLSQQPQEALTGMAGVEGLEMRTQELAYRRTVAAGGGNALLREEFDLPEGLDVRETLFATAHVLKIDVTGGQGHAGVSGSVQLDVCHASGLPGKPLVRTQHVIPFDHAVDLSGEAAESLSAHVTVQDVAVASQEASDGGRTLRTEVQLSFAVQADRDERVTLLCDAYTTHGDGLLLTPLPVRFRTGDSDLHTAESGKAQLLLPEGSPPVRTVLACFASPVLTGHTQSGGRLHAEGMLEATLLYMTDDSTAPVSVTVEEPFRLTFAASTGDDDVLLLHLTDADASAVTSDRAELRYVMHLTVHGMRTDAAELIADAVPVSAPEMPGGVILTFAQHGDDAWSIARQYRIPVARLRELNPVLSDAPPEGQGVIVWKKA